MNDSDPEAASRTATPAASNPAASNPAASDRAATNPATRDRVGITRAATTPVPTPAEIAAADRATACHARQILDRIGDKWSLAVIHQLGTTRRFTELRRAIDGISQRMLTVTLRGLERDGLVERTVHPVIPPRVDYTLTPLGRTLLGTVCTLMSWSVEHGDEIDQARAAYDARQRGR
jgi:DNA-binding HxlR family transcriptional regulator